MIINAKNTTWYRDEVINYIKEKQFKRVIDVGGSMIPWASEVVTHYFDLLDPKDVELDEPTREQTNKAKFIQGDICEEESWYNLCNQTFPNTVQPFDFAICTQTLEDIRNPSLVLKWLPRIAKEGYIDVPSKYIELCKGLEFGSQDHQTYLGITGHYRGYGHHRWIFSIINNELVLFPKIVVLEVAKGFEWATPDKTLTHINLSFFWKNSIKYKIVNNDFLGPLPLISLNRYRDLLNENVGL